MSRRHQFEVGDMIKILDGNGIEDYAGGWYPDEMNHLIGKTYKIFEIYRPNVKYGPYLGKKTRYRIRDEHGNEWSIDERGAEKVEINSSILIREHISKKGRHVVEAWQNGVVGSAVCHPDDPFDYFYGAKLALERLKEAQKRIEALAKLEEARRKKEEAKKKIAALKALTTEYITEGFVII